MLYGPGGFAYFAYGHSTGGDVGKQASHIHLCRAALLVTGLVVAVLAGWTLAGEVGQARRSRPNRESALAPIAAR